MCSVLRRFLMTFSWLYHVLMITNSYNLTQSWENKNEKPQHFVTERTADHGSDLKPNASFENVQDCDFGKDV